MFQSGKSDPLVKLKLTGCKTQKTKYIPKNLDPTWNEAFVFSGFVDYTKSLEVKVEDYEFGMPSNNFIGTAFIDLRSFADKKPRQNWYELGNKKGENDGVKRGEIELQIHWKFNPAIAGIAPKQGFLSRMKSATIGKVKKYLDICYRFIFSLFMAVK